MNQDVKDAMLEAVVEAALGGHELGQWEETLSGDGWQADCQHCAGNVWVGRSGVRYSLLKDTCPAADV